MGFCFCFWCLFFFCLFFSFFFSFFNSIFLRNFFWGVSTQNIKLAGSPKALCLLLFCFSLSVGLSCCEKSFVAVFCQHADLVGWGTSLMFDASLSSDGADACQAWLLRPATHQPKLSRLQDVCCKYLWSFDLTFPSNFLYYI